MSPETVSVAIAVGVPVFCVCLPLFCVFWFFVYLWALKRRMRK